ncbi:hypothetical protein [Methylobacterium sp. DCY52]|uniref:hypothetical protein n=1 Tax=Methylobacterium sp. DCY52 TaxID=739139 RepID=UPI0031456C5A
MSPEPITWAQLIALALFLFSISKGVDWIVGTTRTGTKEAVSPLTIDMEAAKIEIRSLDEKLNAFKIEVART